MTKHDTIIKNQGEIVIYQSDEGALKLDVKIADESVWLNQQQLAALFETSKQLVSHHISNIFNEGELDRKLVVKDYLTIAADEKKYRTHFYNLDMIISLGYRINSKIATAFRQWATARLKEYIIKGFTLDDERLKQNGGRYFKELLQRIRDIRSSERNLWQQVTDIYATSIDYDSRSPTTREFFATVQNKMHYAVHRQTAAEVIYHRVDATQPLIGMTNFKGDYITREDTHIAKNYLTVDELNQLNLLVSRFLDYAELQALSRQTMTMRDWQQRLDLELETVGRPILSHKGQISHRQAVQKANTEYDKYRHHELAGYQSDFDRAVAELVTETKHIGNQSITKKHRK